MRRTGEGDRVLVEVLSDRGRGPVVAYLPGIDGSGELLLGTAGRLEGAFRLLRLRYHHPAGITPTYGDLARAAVETLRQRQATPCLLLAESFGGAVALRCALDARDEVRALVLVNSFPHFRRRLALGLSRLFAHLPRAAFEAGRSVFGGTVLFGRRRPEEVWKAFRGAPLRLRLPEYRQRLRMIAGLDLRPELSELHQPLLVVAGDRDLIVDSVYQARVFMEAVGDAEAEVVAGGGHLLLPLPDLPWAEWLHRTLRRAAPAEASAGL